MSQVTDIARAARSAQRQLGSAPGDSRTAALHALAGVLATREDEILKRT